MKIKYGDKVKILNEFYGKDVIGEIIGYKKEISGLINYCVELNINGRVITQYYPINELEKLE